MEYIDRNHFTIEVQSSTSKTGFLQILVDTGALKSVLKHGSVKGCTLINTNEVITLGSAFDGTKSTLGTTEVNLRFSDKYETNWKFHIL